MEAPSTSKQARKFLEMKQKLEVQSFCISASQVYKICKAREVIDNNLKDSSTQKTSKIMKRKAQHPEVDKAVFELAMLHS